jgi:hypothetical protein
VDDPSVVEGAVEVAELLADAAGEARSGTRHQHHLVVEDTAEVGVARSTPPITSIPHRTFRRCGRSRGAATDTIVATASGS